MKFTGNIRKLTSSLEDIVEYKLPLFDNLSPQHEIPINELIGDTIKIQFEHEINCVVTGSRIKKTFGEGMSYDSFMTSPMASPSIIRPELSRIHEGIALRDEEWERRNHLQPHAVYLAKTAGVKVGVTRMTQIPTRWIDQGAVQAIILAETPYRQAAGLIEVALKDHIADKTNWQRMLKNELSDADLTIVKKEMASHVPSELQQYIVGDNTLTDIAYPVLAYPDKVKSIRLDKVPIIEKKLIGVRGQYLLFDDTSVFNIRSHAGYAITLQA